MPKLNNFEQSGTDAAHFDAAGNPISAAVAANNEAAATMGYGPSKPRKGQQEAVAEELPVEEELFSVQAEGPSSTLRFQHKFSYHDAIIYAKEVSSQGIAKIKNAVKKISEQERGLKHRQQKLQLQGVRIQNGINALQKELSESEIDDERLAEIEGQLTSLWAEESQLSDEMEVCSNDMDALIESGFEIMAGVAKEHIVAASYKSGGLTKFVQEVEFTSKKARSEVAQIIVDLSRLTVSEHANLKGR